MGTAVGAALAKAQVTTRGSAAALGRLAVDATLGLTDVVEAMHGTIARLPFPIGAPRRASTRGITRLVYQSIRSATRMVGGGLDLVLPLLPELPRGADALVSTINGVAGDHLEETHSPLAIPMQLRRRETAPTDRVLVLVHGLCMSDAQWRRRGHDHGEALSRRLGFTPVYARYNSGRHVSANGRDLSAHLEAMVASWPVPVREVVLLGHSMGGLVARSACHYAKGQRWLERLGALVCLGTPHHGAPLERGGNLLDLLLGISPYAAPIGSLGGNRSVGIRDLRFGNVVDEDWAGRAPRHRHDPRTPVPLPDGVRCIAIAGARGRTTSDGLVPVESALGRHADPRLALAFQHEVVLPDTGHMDLLNAPGVEEQLVRWLS